MPIYTDFTTGLVLQTTDTAGTDMRTRYGGCKAAAVCENVRVDERGIQREKGYIRAIETPLAGLPSGLYRHVKRSGANAGIYDLVSYGNQLYRKQGTLLTSLYSSLTVGKAVFMLTWNNLCLIMNGAEYLEYDGVTITPVTVTDPNGKWAGFKPAWAAIHRNRIFLLCDPLSPDDVLTPNPGTHNDFSGPALGSQNARFTVSKGDSGNLVAAHSLTEGILVFFKETSIHTLTGSEPFDGVTDPFRIEEYSREVGCIAARTVVELEGDLYFLAANGYKQLSRVKTSNGLLETDDPMYEIKPLLDSYNPTLRGNAVAIYVPTDRRIWLAWAGAGATINSTVVTLDVATKGIAPRTGIEIGIAAVLGEAFVTGGSDGWLNQQLTEDSYAGGNIPTIWESLWLDMGSSNQRKMFKKLFIYLKSASLAKLKVFIKFKENDGTEKVLNMTENAEQTLGGWDIGNWDEMDWDSGQDATFRRNRLGRGCAIKIRIEGNDPDEPWWINRIELDAENRGIVGR